MALNTFYEEVIELADKFTEAYQGRHGLVGPISLMSAKKTTNIIYLNNQINIRKSYETLKKPNENSSFQY